MRKCKGFANHDVFCYQGLTHRSKLIFEHILEEGSTVPEIASATGISEKTVLKWLKVMNRITDLQTGEIISMVYQEEEKWFKMTPCNLDRVAEVLNVAGIQQQRERIHQQQRESHELALKRSRMNGDCQSM